MSWSNMHVHMLPLHVRNEYACPHDTTPTCPDVKTHVWNLMFHNCMSNMHSEKNCMSTRYLFVKLHVHVAKCMSQNCHYANCMSNMQFKSELHVHKLKILMMTADIPRTMTPSDGDYLNPRALVMACYRWVKSLNKIMYVEFFLSDWAGLVCI